LRWSFDDADERKFKEPTKSPALPYHPQCRESFADVPVNELALFLRKLHANTLNMPSALIPRTNVPQFNVKGERRIKSERLDGVDTGRSQRLANSICWAKHSEFLDCSDEGIVLGVLLALGRSFAV
jgi:hypothetical protein